LPLFCAHSRRALIVFRWKTSYKVSGVRSRDQRRIPREVVSARAQRLAHFFPANRGLEEARGTGTLEHLLITQTSLPVFVAGSAIYPFVATTLRIVIYVAWAAALFGFPLHAANWLTVFAVLLVTLLAFSGLGILSASYLLLFKRGNPAKWFFLGISSVAGGMLFPVSILPDWLQFVARLNPVTHALEAMRASLLGGATIAALWRPLGVLLLFAAVLLPLSMSIFAWSLRRTKITGTLSHS
jgi:ABC-2 type transport system permease protein